MRTEHTLNLFLALIVISVLLSACAPSTTAANPLSTASAVKTTKTDHTLKTPNPTMTYTPDLTQSKVETKTPTQTPTITATPTSDLRLDPADWQNWPVIPTLSTYAKAIYTGGIESGSQPNKFSKVGDCQNITTYFMAIFDDPDQFRLGPDYDYLQEAIDHFSGSFSRESIAVKGGMNVASVLSKTWVDEEHCKNNESPLDCELRLNNPSIVLISMEESWGKENKIETYEKYMRLIIERVIDHGAIPILATKADNVEGDHQINQAIARLAYAYDIPLWNFWSAVQSLTNHGLLEDGFHLTHGQNYFDQRANLKQAWPMRNLTALQVIDSVWRQANDLPLHED